MKWLCDVSRFASIGLSHSTNDEKRHAEVGVDNELSEVTVTFLLMFVMIGRLGY